MNKIFNWTFGSIFRTIGRIIAYLIIGFILFSFINFDKIKDDIKKGVSLDSWVSLPKVYADSYEYPFTYAYIIPYYGDQAGAYALPQIGDSQIMDFFGYNLGGSMYGGSFNKSFYFANQNVDNMKIARFYLYYTDNSYILDSPKSQISIFARALTQTSSGSLLYNACTFNSIGNGNNFGYIDCSVEKNSHIMYGLNFMIRIEGSAPSDYSFGVSSMVSFSHFDVNPSSTDTILSTINNSINNQTNSITQNQNQNTQSIINNQNQNFNNLNSTIMDDSLPSNMSGLDNSYLSGLLPPGPLDSVVNIPLSLMNTIVNTLSGTCSPIVIELPFIHENLTIPCISNIFSNITGLVDFYNGVGVIASAFILYKYLCYLYYWFDDVSSMKNLKPRLFGVASDADYWGGVE